jgi:FkbM family methyltransferase
MEGRGAAISDSKNWGTMSNNKDSKNLSILDNLFLTLPTPGNHHDPRSKIHMLLKQVARREVESLFSSDKAEARDFGPFGKLVFPYFKMGNIDSLNLFDLGELIIFSFYLTNRNRYRHVLDIGANIGLHSIILSKCGFKVRAYEPDPKHLEVLKRNLKLNKCANVQPFNAAVSSKAGEMEFVRVLGNTTASHLAGSKLNPYGDLEKFPVRVEAFTPLIAWADLVKLDIEGHEKIVLLSTGREHWLKTDAFVEIENAGNAAAIFKHFDLLGINLFSQKTNWQQVRNIDDMPTSYHEGTLFISSKSKMPWENLSKGQI